MGIRDRLQGAYNGLTGRTPTRSFMEDFSDMGWQVIKTRNWSNRQELVESIRDLMVEGKTLRAAHMMLTNSEMFWGAGDKAAWSEIAAEMNYLIFVLEVYAIGDVCAGDEDFFRYIVTGSKYGVDYQDPSTGESMIDGELEDKFKGRLGSMEGEDVFATRYYNSALNMCIRQILVYVREEHISQKPIVIVGGMLPQFAHGQPPDPLAYLRTPPRDGEQPKSAPIL